MGFIIFILLLTAVLFVKDRKKTLKGLKMGGKKFLKIMPVFLSMLVFVAIALTLLPENMISEHLSGNNSYLGAFLRSGFRIDSCNARIRCLSSGECS